MNKETELYNNNWTLNTPLDAYIITAYLDIAISLQIGGYNLFTKYIIRLFWHNKILFTVNKEVNDKIQT